MNYRTYFLIFILFVFVLLVIELNAEVEIALEAELADVIQAPMVIAEETGTSDGKYVWMEGPKETGGGNQGWVEFIIDIPKTGEYALWGHVFAWDGNSDSFWVTWQPSDPDEDPQVTNNFEYRWSISTKKPVALGSYKSLVRRRDF